MYMKEERCQMKIKSLLKKLVIICIFIYVSITFFNQQKILNTYSVNRAEIEKKLAEAKKHGEELQQTKQNVNSKEYIEKVAREKLDMYLSNERVYINQEQ